MKRPRNVIIAAATSLVLVATATLGYRWITSSRAVSASSAVAQYRQQNAPPATSAPTLSAAPSTDAPKAAAPGRAKALAAAPTSRPAAGHAAAKPSWWNPPASGVYTWKTTGSEKATFSRNYPAQSQRIIDTNNGSYENHHIFSREHEEWFTLRPTDGGGVMLKRRMRITFGPVTVDQTVNFDPALPGVPVPYKLGRTWSGSWKGDTYGTYTAKTIDHRTLKIGDQPVEVWVNELRLKMQGKVSGSVVATLWYAPKLGMDAREDGIYDVRSQGTPGTYHTEYTVTLDSIHPQR